MRKYRTDFLNLPFSIATGFYCGLSPRAPGTVGSIASIPLWLAIYYLGLWSSLPSRLLIVALVVALGVWATGAVLKQRPTEKDPQFIVIDEWAGMFIAFLAVSETSLLSILLVLFWFRFFDILKPGPVGWSEKFSGAWGVMADDCVAGVMAGVMVVLSLKGLGNT